MKKSLKTKMGLFYSILIVSTLLLSVSYGIFVLASSKYNATDMLIGNLMYGISIEDEEGNSLSTITSNANTTKYYYVTVYSINSVNSKYTLAYKPVSDNNGLTVTASNRSGWNASGSIKNYENYAYKRTVKIEVKNESNIDKTLTFKAFGGYTYNTVANINLGSGYYSVINGLIESLDSERKVLTSLIEEDTNCTTTSSTPCLYGGESTSNYARFENTSDLYRVVGSYQLEEKIAKLVAVNLTSTTNKEDIATNLNSFYSNLDEDYIYKTNKFNCTSSGCTTSSYNNIGLLTKYEYNLLDGVNSYLNINESYYILEDNVVKELNSDGTTSDTNSSNLRPVVYLDKDIKVIGSGTVEDPYILSKDADINIIAYTVNGNNPSPSDSYSTYESALGTTYGADIECKNGSKAIVNSKGEITFTYTSVRDYCTVNFRPLKWYDDEDTLGYHIMKDNTVLGERSDFSINYTENTPNTLYKTNDTEDNSTVYYFAGQNANNYVLFGQYNTDLYYSSTGSEETGTLEYHYANTNCSGCELVANKGDYMIWRIIRTNTDLEEGGIRLIYHGSGKLNTDGSVTLTTNENGIVGKYNDNNTGPGQGYMYGSGTTLAEARANTYSSIAKQKIDEWYSSYLAQYGGYLNNNAIYCNDREPAFETSYEANNYVSQAVMRVTSSRDDVWPSYACGAPYQKDLRWTDGIPRGNVADKFTVNQYNSSNEEVGNGDLKYPIGMMTSDEAKFMGMKLYTGYDFNLWENPNWLLSCELANCSSSPTYGSSIYHFYFTTLMSPTEKISNGLYTLMSVGYTDEFGRLYNYKFFGSIAPNYQIQTFRPVISLKADVKWEKGDGSASNPYIVGQYYDKETAKTAIDTYQGAECPGCVFRFDTDSSHVKCTVDATWSGCTNGAYPNTLSSSEYTTDYKSLNSNYFLGYVLGEDDGNGNKPILAHYACEIENNQLYCFRGYVNQDERSKTYKPNYYERINKMNAIIPTCNAPYTGDEQACSGSSVRFIVGAHGTSSVISGSSYCYADYNGASRCVVN